MRRFPPVLALLLAAAPAAAEETGGFIRGGDAALDLRYRFEQCRSYRRTELQALVLPVAGCPGHHELNPAECPLLRKSVRQLFPTTMRKGGTEVRSGQARLNYAPSGEARKQYRRGKGK